MTIYGNSKWNKFFDDYMDSFVQTRMSPMFLTSRTNLTDHSSWDFEKNHTKDGEYIMIEVPGFNKSNLTVEVDGTNLIVTGKRTYKVNGKDNEKTITKTINIGEIFDISQIEATVQDGILTVFTPNKHEVKKQRINIV